MVAGGGCARWTEALPHLVPHAGPATYIKPRMPGGGVLRGLQAHSYPGSATDVGRRCRGLPGDGAEREPAGWSRVSSPSSLLSLGRCSGGGALRLRTFHSSLHTPFSGQPLIGYTWSDVTASFVSPPPHLTTSLSMPVPLPPQASPRRAIGEPLPQRMGWDRGSNVFLRILILLMPHLLPACHVGNPLPVAVLMATLALLVDPTFSIWALRYIAPGLARKDRK